MKAAAALGAWVRRVFSRAPLRYLLIIILGLVIFAVILIAAGKNPLKAYADTFSYTFGNAYGFSELLVRMIPLLLTAVAVALPARIGMINVGGEGQLYLGAWLATGGALAFPGFPAWALLPIMALLGFLGGAAWAAIPGILRAKKLVNETIATLLLNYVAPMIVSFFIFGPWRGQESSSYPQSPAFVDAARLPSFFNTRIHVGLLFALVSLLAYWLLVERSRWGVQMRAIGGNPEAAERLGIPIVLYTVLVMAIGGGIAGLAGMGEVSAIQGRLRQGLSPGYGFTGFLIAWLAGGNPLGILLMAFLFAVITSVGDILQITQGLPYAVVDILMAVILFVVLGEKTRAEGRAMIGSLLRGVIAGSILSGTPLLYATLGEVIVERSGIVNLGLEGILLIGASVAFAIASVTGSAYLGVLAAAMAGGLATLLFGYLVVGRRANQLASGLALMFFGTGVSALVGRSFVGGVIDGLPKLRVPWLADLSWVRGSTLFNWDILVYLAIPVSFLVFLLLFYTRWGLGVRAVGESPSAAFAAGRRPELLQYQALFLGGFLGGVAGAHLSVSLTMTWNEGMTSGRGFIAIALVIFSKWHPLRAIVGALVFGGAEALQLQLQARGAQVSPFLLDMLPYLLTLAVLIAWGGARRNAAPAGLGRTFYGTE